jgi:hypothetical protein
MARAGYDPMDLARMFQTIEQQGGSSGPEWLSSHPNPGNRYGRISEEAKKLMVASGPRSGQSREFTQIQASLKSMPPARSSAEIAKSGSTNTGNQYPDGARVGGTVQRPSDRYRRVDVSGLFRISVPDNWKEFRDNASITFAPDGAYGNVQGQSVFTHGAIVSVLEVSSSNDLARVSDRFISGILQGNSYLQPNGGYQQERINGHDALRRRLSGTSPVTNRKEIVDVHTAFTNRGRLFAIVQVVPGNEQSQYQRAFSEMVNSTTFLD